MGASSILPHTLPTPTPTLGPPCTPRCTLVAPGPCSSHFMWCALVYPKREWALTTGRRTDGRLGLRLRLRLCLRLSYSLPLASRLLHSSPSPLPSAACPRPLCPRSPVSPPLSLSRFLPRTTRSREALKLPVGSRLAMEEQLPCATS